MRHLLTFLFAVPLLAQVGPIPGGGPCKLSGSPTSGYVLTSTGGSGCSWQSAGSASVDANAIKNAWYIADTSVSANLITGTTATTFPGAYAAGQAVVVRVANSNTGATSININTLGVKAITKNGTTALAPGNLVAGNDYILVFDGAEFQVLNYTLTVSDVPIVFQVGGVNNATQGTLNLVAGTNVTLTNSGSSVTIAASASGGGSPGGTSGQVQYNNAGSFGGFTMGGDGTLNTSTGALTVTGIDGVAVYAPDSTAGASIAIGNSALGGQANSTNYANVAMGYKALGGIASTLGTAAIQNTAVGYQALGAVTSGTGMTALGYRALLGVTSGLNNVGIGWNAGTNITTGNYNVVMGHDAGGGIGSSGTNNTCIGEGTCYDGGSSNTNVSNNTAVGAAALLNISNGGNTAIGVDALTNAANTIYNAALGINGCLTVTTGAYNTCLGSFADVTSAAGNYRTAIGYNARGATDHTITLGTSSESVVMPGHTSYTVVGTNSSGTVTQATTTGSGTTVVLATSPTLSSPTITGTLTIAPGGGSAGTYDLLCGTTPTSPSSGYLSPFCNSANSNHYSVVNSSGTVTDLTPVVTSLTTTGTSGAATLSGGVLNIPQYSSSGGSISTQSGNLGTRTSNPTGSSARLLSTVYQNTLSVPIFVSVACNGVTTTDIMTAVSDSSSSPSQYVALQTTQAGFWSSIAFWVIPNNYYEVSATHCNATGASGTIWTEWH